LTILEQIVATKQVEISALRSRDREIEAQAVAASPARPFEAALKAGGEVAVIAEFKRRSPSGGPIREGADPAAIARSYERAGAAALSILTDREYFGGSLDDMIAARAAVSIPVLRKDFIVDPLQILEARAAGADAVLLIVRILTVMQLASLHAMVRGLGMTALVEVHNGQELDRALRVDARVIGVNNRDLATLETSLDVSLGLARRLPPDRLLVAESGIRTAADVDRLAAAGVQAILVGESFLRAPDVEAAAAALIGRPRSASVSRRAAPTS
jgi:indole-3-glycerol phosphate synthase